MEILAKSPSIRTALKHQDIRVGVYFFHVRVIPKEHHDS